MRQTSPGLRPAAGFPRRARPAVVGSHPVSLVSAGPASTPSQEQDRPRDSVFPRRCRCHDEAFHSVASRIDSRTASTEIHLCGGWRARHQHHHVARRGLPRFAGRQRPCAPRARLRILPCLPSLTNSINHQSALGNRPRGELRDGRETFSEPLAHPRDRASASSKTQRAARRRQRVARSWPWKSPLRLRRPEEARRSSVGNKVASGGCRVSPFSTRSRALPPPARRRRAGRCGPCRPPPRRRSRARRSPCRRARSASSTPAGA